MVFHWSCVLLLRSRIATRRIFFAVRLSSLNTTAHNRTHPIALSYSGDDLRFIGVRFLFSSIYIEQKRGYGCTLLRATRTQIAMNRQKETGKTGAATGNLNFPASYCDQSQTRPEETALDRDKTLTGSRSQAGSPGSLPSQGSGHPVSASNNGVNRQAKAENPYSNGGW